MNNHRFTWSILYTSKFIINNKSTLWHYTEPFNFDAIFHRIRILLHKSEPNRNPAKQNRNRTEQIVPRFFGYPWQINTIVNWSVTSAKILLEIKLLNWKRCLSNNIPIYPVYAAIGGLRVLTSWRFPLTGIAITNVSGDFLYPILLKVFSC